MILVYGSTSSGKSEYAENLAVKLAKNESKLYYLATMENLSDAAKRRIRHHEKQRDGKGFTTIEEMYEPARCLDKCCHGVVLLECISNLVANRLYRDFGSDVIDDEKIGNYALEIFNSILELDLRTRETVIVSNNVFDWSDEYDLWCQSYLKVLGELNILLAKHSSAFIEVTCNIPYFLKGDIEF